MLAFLFHPQPWLNRLLPYRKDPWLGFWLGSLSAPLTGMATYYIVRSDLALFVVYVLTVALAALTCPAARPASRKGLLSGAVISGLLLNIAFFAFGWFAMHLFFNGVLDTGPFVPSPYERELGGLEEKQRFAYRNGELVVYQNGGTPILVFEQENGKASWAYAFSQPDSLPVKELEIQDVHLGVVHDHLFFRGMMDGGKVLLMPGGPPIQYTFRW